MSDDLAARIDALLMRRRRFDVQPIDAPANGQDPEPDPPTRYIAVAGTHGYTAPWCCDLESPFAQMMTRNRFVAIRARDGRPFRWTTDLAGLRPWAKERDWLAGADALDYFAWGLPYSQLNFIAHSHGGQVAIFLAASGFKIRTLTTIGTPPRDDVPAEKALANIGLWQHIFDVRWDWMGLLGQFGEGFTHGFRKRRSFRLPGVRDLPLLGISHSSILYDAQQVTLWERESWLAAIRAGE